MQSINFENEKDYVKSPCRECFQKINEPIFESLPSGVPGFVICGVEYGSCRSIEHYRLEQNISLDVRPYY